jgi:hypothetical protein
MVLTREILLKNEMRRVGHVAGVGKKKGENMVLMVTPENNEIAWRKWENNLTRQAMHVRRNIEVFSCNHFCSGKAIIITYSGCVCSLRYPACNAHAPYFHLWPAPLYYFFFPHLKNGTIFEKKKLLKMKSAFWFSLQLSSETFLILGRTERDMIKNYIGLHVKYPLFLSDFNEA